MEENIDKLIVVGTNKNLLINRIINQHFSLESELWEAYYLTKILIYRSINLCRGNFMEFRYSCMKTGQPTKGPLP